jgi:N-acyl amino acid synthase of PEP-CTERM/exosortase system
MVSYLKDNFYKHFRIIEATDTYLLEQVYKLRYEVLCLEKEVDSFVAEKYPEGLEIDLYDQRSSHYLIYNLDSGRYVATVRMIFSDGTNDLNSFPLVKYTQADIDMPAISKLPCNQVAEISRLIITKDFRSRPRYFKFTKGAYEDYKKITRENHLVTHPIIGLLAAILKMSSNNHCCPVNFHSKAI